ncbi:ABC transporter ATP-binding protein [Paenibacillus tuaregi]|uniref:ABC transporter ATP-binding protein n=1 Tax=Paenibacillus tuaregi TaxID=1816681 RepID=UPI000837F557|nr:ATP-binding cassette domain-containing protein [Paenibacillus tuaregi]
MPDPYLAIRDIHKAFGTFTALEPIRIDIQKNEFVCLLGPSGCGKTTLLRIIAGLEAPDGGSITVAGRDITSLPPAKRNAGMMFQSYALFPNLTTAQNIAYGLKEKRMSRAQISEKVHEVLAMVDLEHAVDKYPAQLSGGQQQRVALARAVALSPDFLLLDEPLSALDAKVRQKLRKEVRRLHDQLGMTTIMVTHDQEEALTMADKIVVMNNAKVIQTGSPEEVYEQPKTRFVADFIGAVNFMDNGWLQHPEYDKDSELGIRPEHIRISDRPTAYSREAVVTDSEFRGAFYRLSIRLAAHLGGEEPIYVDVPASFAKRLHVHKNLKVYVEFPENQIIGFGTPRSGKLSVPV